MKAYKRITVLLLSLLPLSMSYAASLQTFWEVLSQKMIIRHTMLQKQVNPSRTILISQK